MNETEAQTVAEKLRKNMAEIRYGTVAVTLTIHDGRIVETTFSRNERNRGGALTKETEGENHE